MKDSLNKDYIKNIQYSTSKNLDTRIALHKKYSLKGKDIWDFVWSRYFNENDKVLSMILRS